MGKGRGGFSLSCQGNLILTSTAPMYTPCGIKWNFWARLDGDGGSFLRRRGHKTGVRS